MRINMLFFFIFKLQCSGKCFIFPCQTPAVGAGAGIPSQVPSASPFTVFLSDIHRITFFGSYVVKCSLAITE